MSVLDGLQTYLAGRNLELVVHLCGSDQDPEIHLRRTLTQFQLSHQELSRWLGENMVNQLASKAGNKRMKQVNKIWPMEMIVGGSTGIIRTSPA